ncbi:MAG: hypothetical protein WCV99_11720 [Sterolibacterium sp.]|jgi:hypothetical protein
MDILTFITELVKAAAWPITAVVVALLFRAEFRALLGRLKKGKVGAAEFEFQEQVAELAKDIAEVSTAPQPVTLSAETIRLATSNPRGVLVSTWFEVEVALKNLAQKHNLLDAQSQRNPSALVRVLARAGLIPMSHAPGFTALYRLRNQAAHDEDFNPTEEAVLGYLEIAEELKQVVAQAGNAR